MTKHTIRQLMVIDVQAHARPPTEAQTGCTNHMKCAEPALSPLQQQDILHMQATGVMC